MPTQHYFSYIRNLKISANQIGNEDDFYIVKLVDQALAVYRVILENDCCQFMKITAMKGTYCRFFGNNGNKGNLGKILEENLPL